MSLKQQSITEDTSNGFKHSTNGEDNGSTNGKDTNPEIQSFIDLQMEKERIRLVVDHLLLERNHVAQHPTVVKTGHLAAGT